MAGQISVIQPQFGQPPQTVYVSFTAEITPLTSESLLAVMPNLVQQRIAHVQLLLATPGGNVMNGITLYNAVRAFPFELTTHNMGNVDSIGNAVFLAGEHRYACSNATFMIHGVGFQAPQQMHFQERQLRERLASVLADQKRIGEII